MNGDRRYMISYDSAGSDLDIEVSCSFTLSLFPFTTPPSSPFPLPFQRNQTKPRTKSPAIPAPTSSYLPLFSPRFVSCWDAFAFTFAFSERTSIGERVSGFCFGLIVDSYGYHLNREVPKELCFRSRIVGICVVGPSRGGGGGGREEGSHRSAPKRRGGNRFRKGIV